MKKIRRIFVSVISFVLMLTACFAFTGCKDIKNGSITISYYDYATSTQKEVTISLELYREFAPETVDAISKYINDGYYDDCVFYKTATESSAIMIGDLKMVDGEIVQNDIKPTLDGEFEHGKVKGSNLTNTKGSIGLWRTWTAHDNTHQTSTSTDTGRATWYMPLTNSAISNYEGWFCIFAQMDLSSDEASTAFSVIDALFTIDTYYEEYVIYYTGEYDETKADQNHGLTFNCVPADMFEEGTEVFEAEGDQLVCYNKTTIRIAVAPETKEVAAKIVSGNVK